MVSKLARIKPRVKTNVISICQTDFSPSGLASREIATSLRRMIMLERSDRWLAMVTLTLTLTTRQQFFCAKRRYIIQYICAKRRYNNMTTIYLRKAQIQKLNYILSHYSIYIVFFRKKKKYKKITFNSYNIMFNSYIIHMYKTYCSAFNG